MKKTKIYAAYGSNLNHAQMRGRCPDAKYLGSAMLKDQNLIFCGAAGSQLRDHRKYGRKGSSNRTLGDQRAR